MQLVKQFPNCQAIVTAGSPQKIDFCRSQGADYGINYKEEKEFSSKLLEVTGKKGVDILLDFVGGPYWNGRKLKQSLIDNTIQRISNAWVMTL